jgi:mannose-6-phosphate isomerase-like protein (cupin superfamily)
VPEVVPMTTTARDVMQVFDLHVPILSSGRLDRLVVDTDDLWISVKVYASGGENELHQHTAEAHAFVVLHGRATFFDEHGHETVVEPYGGVFLPKGVLYRFQSSGDEALVMLRIGTGGSNPYRTLADRLDAAGRLADGSAAKVAQDPVVETGEIFGIGTR